MRLNHCRDPGYVGSFGEMVVDRFYDFGTEESDLATVKAAIAKAKGE